MYFFLENLQCIIVILLSQLNQFKYFTKNSVFVTRPLVKFKIDKKS